MALSARDKFYQDGYGILEADYQEKFKAQGGVCYLCEFPPKRIRLAVDHRHVKGYSKMSPEDKAKEVRGLLCFTCNKGIGFLLEAKGDARMNLQRLNEYFMQYKMKGDA